ncbi:MAG: MerR family transcriptional regulator [Candidatus Dormibacteraceae bacterium]
MITQEADLRIEAVAVRTGLTKRAIRYYEELGLVSAVSRSESGQRLYSADDIRRLTRIRELKEGIGLSLGEIQALLDADTVRDRLRERYRATDDIGERLAALRESVAAVSSQLQVITRKREALAALQVEYEDRLARLRQAMNEIAADDH